MNISLGFGFRSLGEVSGSNALRATGSPLGGSWLQEAYLQRSQWVNYFWHAGHLHIEGAHMALGPLRGVSVGPTCAVGFPSAFSDLVAALTHLPCQVVCRCWSQGETCFNITDTYSFEEASGSCRGEPGATQWANGGRGRGVAALSMKHQASWPGPANP